MHPNKAYHCALCMNGVAILIYNVVADEVWCIALGDSVLVGNYLVDIVLVYDASVDKIFGV